MNSSMVLSVLEMAGLVRSVATGPKAEYAFRHGLLQETVYHSLLKQERQKLHLLVGEAIESNFPERGAELSPLLGGHFLRGGDEARALHYFTLAGEQSRIRYANAEALEYFETAIDLARRLDRPTEEANLLRELGLTHEIVGDLETARQEHRKALGLGRELADLEIEWQALLDLGKVWAAQDYSKAGENFREALEVARRIGDREAIARSLNRLGNWHINLGESEESKRYHEEALEIFEELDHERGIAETLDFLGMTNMISSDIRRGTEYYDRAIPILRSLDDKQRLASAITARALRAGQSQAETVVGLPVSVEQVEGEIETAIELTREIGWKSGHCFALWMSSFVLSSAGRFDEALQRGNKAHAMASEIEHVQWLAASSCALGRACLEMLDNDTGREHLERALKLARETGSRYWHGVTAGTLGMLCTQQGDFERADEVLAWFMDPPVGMTMTGDRLVWTVKAGLLLRQSEYEEALRILDDLLTDAPNLGPGKVIPGISRNRGLAAMGLGRWEAAREEFEAALDWLDIVGARSLQWKLYGDLSRAYTALGRSEMAQEQAQAGEALVRQLADNISDAAQREKFHQGAIKYLSPSSAPNGAQLAP